MIIQMSLGCYMQQNSNLLKSLLFRKTSLMRQERFNELLIHLKSKCPQDSTTFSTFDLAIIFNFKFVSFITCKSKISGSLNLSLDLQLSQLNKVSCKVVRNSQRTLSMLSMVVRLNLLLFS